MPPVSASSTCFTLRTELNGKYLQSVYVKNAGGSRVEASADSVPGKARARFIMEGSDEEKGHMHVRCCYNNKYWVPVQVQHSGSSCWFIGTADEPEEDLSSPSCTLFQKFPVENKDNSFKFLHSGLRKFACVVSIGGKTYLQLVDEDYQGKKYCNFTVGYLPQHELPKHVAFKADNGSKYLGTQPFGTAAITVLSNAGLVMAQIFSLVYPGPSMRIARQHHLQFHVKDIKDARAFCTTFTNDDGTVRIMCNKGGYWSRDSNNLILYNKRLQDPNNRDSMFEVVTRDGFVALRNLGNKKYCRLLDEWGFDCLSACDDSISQWARLKLEVPVVSRQISDVKFHLDEARFYDQKIVNVLTDIRHNDTSREVKATFSFIKKHEMVSTCATSVSAKIGIKNKFSFGPNAAPTIAGWHVTTSVENTGSVAQTTCKRNTDEATITQEYYIAPRTKVAAKLLAGRASCDVPFSYKQTDVLTSGEEVTTNYQDGIYTVTNNYNFRITITDNEDEIRRLE